jgi:FkbM family methyltransferase
LTSAREELIHQAAKDKNWTVHNRVAIGDRNGLIDINISKNSYSSSILPMLKTHLDAAINSEYIGIEKTPIITLDSVADSYLDKDSNCFLKIDTQGYETKVLDGGSKTLAKAKGVLCELSLVKLYAGQELWKDMIIRLEKKGFQLWSIQKGFTDKKNGRTLQVNVVFLKI